MSRIIILLACVLLAAYAPNPSTVRPDARSLSPLEEEVLDRHTVVKKYKGHPPLGVLNDGEKRRIYRATKVEEREWGKTVIYDSDLGEMSIILRRGTKMKGETFLIPYAMCLDYIDENLGRASGGWTLIEIKCNQEGLGKEY